MDHVAQDLETPSFATVPGRHAAHQARGEFAARGKFGLEAATLAPGKGFGRDGFLRPAPGTEIHGLSVAFGRDGVEFFRWQPKLLEDAPRVAAIIAQDEARLAYVQFIGLEQVRRGPQDAGQKRRARARLTA